MINDHQADGDSVELSVKHLSHPELQQFSLHARLIAAILAVEGGLTYTEIAALTGQGVESVKKQVQKLRDGGVVKSEPHPRQLHAKRHRYIGP